MRRCSSAPSPTNRRSSSPHGKTRSLRAKRREDDEREHGERPPAGEPHEPRPNDVELLFDADGPKVRGAKDRGSREVRDVRQEGDVEKQAAVARDAVEIPAPRVAHGGAGCVVHEPGDDHERDEYDDVVRGPDSQRAAHVEVGDRNAAASLFLDEHAVRDQVSTQDEEELHPLASESLQRRPVEMRPGHPLGVLFDVVEEHRDARDATEAVEAPKVGRFCGGGHAATLSSPAATPRKTAMGRRHWLVVVTSATGNWMLPVPPPTSTLTCTEARFPKLQPCCAHAAK